jgi:RNA polymerase sigma factor (TIGR02999 family)
MGRSFLGLLADLKTGNQTSLNEMMPALYAELRRVAGVYMQRERAGHTLQPTALVHEAYLRLVGQEELKWSDRAHLLGLAARTMRRVLIDYAASHNAAKRPGRVTLLPLIEALDSRVQGEIDFVDLDRALTLLEQIDARQAQVVELRFFSGLTMEEVAEVLGISVATVEREWSTARLWLLRHISEQCGQ